MSSHGKTIRLYLVNGSPTDILTAEIINWTGKLLVCPRAQLADLAKREEVRRTGVYCLVGPDPEVAGRDAVYFGEGDNVLTRLAAHDKDESKDFWTRCVVIISKDQNITKNVWSEPCSNELFIGYQCAGYFYEGFVGGVVSVSADADSAVLFEPGDGAFNGPAELS